MATVLRSLARALHRLLKRRSGSGAHAIALTPDRKIILVKLRYARGWRLPGGGREKDESPRDTVLRELREEIGMTAHGRVRDASIASLLVVEDVNYVPRRWSWEIEAIREASLEVLPAGLSPRTAAWLEAARRTL